MTDQHPDPIAAGFSHGGERMIQILAMASALRQGYAQRAARLRAAELAQDTAAERAESAAQQAAFAQARAQWVRAHDRNWLQQAGLLHVAEAWGAAVPYAADSSSAAAAIPPPSTTRSGSCACTSETTPAPRCRVKRCTISCASISPAVEAAKIC